MKTLVLLLAAGLLARSGLAQTLFPPFPLSSPVTVGPPGPCPTRFSAADMNGDGRDDVVGGGTSLATMCTLAGGGYGPPAALAPPITGGGYSVDAVADLNNDGMADILATVWASPNPANPFGPPAAPPSTFVRPGLGNCLFGASIGVPDPSNATSWGHACFVSPNVPGLTGPGLPPALVLSSWQGLGAGAVIHTLINSTASFSVVASVAAPLPPPIAGSGSSGTFMFQRAGDVNGDGLLDLVGTGTGLFTSYVVYALGTASPPYFAAPAAVVMTLPAPPPPAQLSDLRDVNNDGLADFVVVDNSGNVVVVYFGHATAPFGASMLSSVGVSIASFFVEDLDGDGAPDLLFRSSVGSGAYTLGFSRGNGLGGFGSSLTIPWSLSIQSTCAGPADENGDGLKDVVASLTGTGGTTFVMRNQSRIGPGVPGSNALVPQTIVGIANAGSPFYFVGVTGGAPNMPAALGVSLGVLAMPDAAGNMLDLSPGMLILPGAGLGFFQTSAAGTAILALSLPPLPALVGQTVFLEWVVQDFGTTGGYSLTPARKVVFW